VHLGRKDAHVKIRGFSVELAEVEAVLRDAVGVRNVVVTTRERTPGHQILVAYVVPTERPAVSIDALRRAVAATLPDYMVPSAFVILDELPLAGPGKVNVRALPEPDRGRPDLGTPLVQPRTPVEEEMARIWAEVLGLDRVGIHDPFLELGGDSLLASQVVSRVIRAFHFDVPLRALLEAPTVDEMALMVVQQKAMRVRREDVGGVLAEVERQAAEPVVRRQTTPEGSD
jgi:acyl carrier protein